LALGLGVWLGPALIVGVVLFVAMLRRPRGDRTTDRARRVTRPAE
jgi:hypothetical protein